MYEVGIIIIVTHKKIQVISTKNKMFLFRARSLIRNKLIFWNPFSFELNHFGIRWNSPIGTCTESLKKIHDLFLFRHICLIRNNLDQLTLNANCEACDRSFFKILSHMGRKMSKFLCYISHLTHRHQTFLLQLF